MMPLILATVGEENMIKKVGGNPEVKKHLENLGFVGGGNVNVISTICGNLIVKTNFKKVYGVSAYSFIRSHKMQSSAFILKNTDRNVLNIAGDVGYDNGSKFAKVFRDVMGVAPK